MARDRAALVSAGVIFVIALLALIGPMVIPYSQRGAGLAAHRVAAAVFASGHWLGTDRLGRDLLVRTLHGVRISLVDRADGDAGQPAHRRDVGRDRGLRRAGAPMS